jgi:molybdopterin/thiamine biosynthesis adenylyltransferase
MIPFVEKVVLAQQGSNSLMRITQDHFKRFEKQIILKKIGIAGQKKIFFSNVLVVGIGGLGCPLISYLAASGVGKIGIVDFDKVEISNLNRQNLFDTSDIGKFKVDQAKKKINKINKKIKVIVFKKKLIAKNIRNIFEKFDIVCDGSDNFNTRYLINDYCVKSKKILITAAISKFNGHLFKFNFKRKGPCYRCFMPEAPSAEKNCQTDGIFSPVAGIMGALQANEVLKSILNLKNDLTSKILLFDALKTEFRKSKITTNHKCINKC